MIQKLPRVLSVTSGKGGVGKTNLSVNLSYQLAKLGKRVVLLDADLGLANVDILLGLNPEKNILDLLSKKACLADILIPTPYGFTILPAASGVPDMLSLSTGRKLELLDALDALDPQTDFLLVDTGAGINDNVLYFNIAAQERLLLLTPEPTSLTDAYALVKVLTVNHGVNRFLVVVNMARDGKEAKAVFTKLHAACDRFLSGVSLDLIGHVPKDDGVRSAVIRQIPFSHLQPDGQAGIHVSEVAKRLVALNVAQKLDGNIKFFWKKLLFRD